MEERFWKKIKNKKINPGPNQSRKILQKRAKFSEYFALKILCKYNQGNMRQS